MYEEGREPPAEFFNQPEIWPDLVPIWNAFFDLSTERQIGMGIGPIPFSAIRTYARDLMGIEDPTSDEFERFRRLIGDLDDEFLAHINKSSTPTRSSKKEPEEISVTDAAGLHGMFRRLAARQKNAKPITKKNRMN